MLHIALEKASPARQPAAFWFNTGMSCRAWRRREDIEKAERSFSRMMNTGTSDKATAITTTDTNQVATKLESMSGHAPNFCLDRKHDVLRINRYRDD